MEFLKANNIISIPFGEMEGLVSTTSKRVRPMRMTCVRHVFVASRRLGTLPPDPPAPPLLLKLRGDMKAAMKAKDINR